VPAPLSDDKRQAILDAIRDGHGVRSARDIGRQHDVSPSTVSKLARDHGLRDAFARAKTKNATAARTGDMREARSQLAQRLIREANEALDDMRKPTLVYAFGGRDNEYNEHELQRPSISDRRSLMTMAAVAIDKHVVLDRHDADAGSDEAVSMLGRIADGLATAYQAAQQTNADEEDDEDGGMAAR
jgi:transposase-like protein